MNEISREKLEWMQEVGIKKFEEPMKYYSGTNLLYSESYIKNTSLEELKAKYDLRLIKEGEPKANDTNLDR